MKGRGSMFSFSRKTDYALLALARLAQEESHGGSRLSARELAVSEGLPGPLLMNLLKALHQAGLVTSVRGAQGGYRLARRAEQITVGDVVRAIEGPVGVALCCQPASADHTGNGQPIGAPVDGVAAEVAAAQAEPACHLQSSCRISASIRQLNQRVEEFFDRVTLADLVRASLQRPATLTYGALSA